MTLAALVPELKDAAAIEIQPGKRYVVFVDGRAVPMEAFEHIAQVDVQIVCVYPAIGQSVADAVAAFALSGKEKAE